MEVPEGARTIVDLAKENLANRLGIEPEQVSVVSVESVSWPDTSLGNPEPGMMYAQVITPGYLLFLSAQGKRYEYHTSTSHAIPVK